jgi:methylated-DNA-[protein]-cysteine S-methyltransferase
VPVQGFSLFDTAIGPCGIAWRGRHVVGVQLPEASAAATRALLGRRFPDAHELAPPAHVERAQGDIRALLSGEVRDLSGIELDLDGLPVFHRRVYDAARKIPAGATCTYGDIARALGEPGAARAVGRALGRNPFAVIVPCHRVVAAGNKPGGFSARGGVSTKLRMLSIERAALRDADAFDFDGAVAVDQLRAADAGLARLIERVGPFRMQLKSTPSLFVALAESIVYQQLGAKAAATIFGRVRALFPRSGLTPNGILRAPDEKLRGAGLSQNKLTALRDLACRAASGELPTLEQARGMDDEALIERLVEVRGIGRWTVEMLLMFRLGRPDVLPVGDYGIQQGYALAFRKRELPSRAEIEKRGRRWKPYRTVASWYLWRAVELGR